MRAHKVLKYIEHFTAHIWKVNRTTRLKLALTAALDNARTVCIAIYGHYSCKDKKKRLNIYILQGGAATDLREAGR